MTLLLSACVHTAPWTGPEELGLALVDKLFLLLGKLPIIPQQTLRSTRLKETCLVLFSCHSLRLGSVPGTTKGSQLGGTAHRTEGHSGHRPSPRAACCLDEGVVHQCHGMASMSWNSPH